MSTNVDVFQMSGPSSGMDMKKRKDDEAINGRHHKIMRMLHEESSPLQLSIRINNKPKTELCLKSKDFFLPSLHQLGNSVDEIKSHYCPKGKIGIAPQYLPENLMPIRDKFLTILQDTGKGLLSRDNMILPTSCNKHTCGNDEAFVFITHSLAVPLNINISSLPKEQVCDIILVSLNQPPLVLSIVDTITTLTKNYNVSIARGLTTSVNRFIDDDFSVVFGVFTASALEDTDNFISELIQRAIVCSSFVTLESLLISTEKYSKVLTAFWASVTQTRSVLLTQLKPDENSIYFLTKEQCIVLLENMNAKNVLVMAQRGTGATTLMLEIARRFKHLGRTLLFFKVGTNLEPYRSIGVETTCLGTTDLSSLDNAIENIVTETILPVNIPFQHETQRVWTFCSDFIKPKLFDDLVQQLSRYQFLLVTGSPGEGNSVLGILLLEHYRNIGKSIKVLDSITDLVAATKTPEDIFVLIDDVFGRLRCTFQLTKEIEFAFEKMQSKSNIKVLFTSRTDVYNHAFSQLGKLQAQFDDNNKFDLSKVVTEDEKRAMLDKYLTDYDKVLSPEIKDEIIRTPTSHGFPHSCQMYAAIQKDDIDPVKFYENPLSYQVDMIKCFLQNKANKCLLYCLVAFKGSLSADMFTKKGPRLTKILSYLGQADNPSILTSIQKAVLTMRYIVQTELSGSISFKHPSLFEVTSNALATEDLAFVIRYGPIELFEEDAKEIQKDQKKFSIHVRPSSEEFLLLTERFAFEMKEGHFQDCCQHPLLTNKAFVISFVEQLKLINLQSDDKVRLFYWSTSNTADFLIRELLSKYEFTDWMIHSAIVGSCRWGNVCALEYVVSHLKLKGSDIDDITEDGLPCMIVAANQNHKAVLKSLINLGTNVMVVDSQMGGTALHWACAAGHLDVLEVLATHIPVDTESLGGIAPLFVAAENGHRPVVKFLISQGAEVNKQIRSRLVSLTRRRNEGHAMVRQLTVSDEGFTALHVASYEGHFELVKDLLALGADPTKSAVQGLPVAIAAKCKHLEIFKEFIGLMSLKMVDILHAAYEYGQIDMISAVLLHERSGPSEAFIASLQGNMNHISNITSDLLATQKHGFTHLHFAAQAGQEDIVHYLITKIIVLVNMATAKGYTALHGASIAGQTSVVLALLKKGANVNWQCQTRNSALHFASLHGHLDTVKALLNHGAEINMPGFRNWSPLHYASIHNKPNIVRYLIDHKADTEALSIDLSTPLVFAAYPNLKQIVDILIDGHAQINTTGQRSNPLVGVALMGSPESTQYLINKGAIVDHLNGLGVGALHAAVFMNSAEVVKCLVDNKAHVDIQMFDGLSREEKKFACEFISQWSRNTPGKDINLTRYDGATPLHIAVDMNNAEIVNVLIAAGARTDIVNQENETPISIAREKGYSSVIKLLESRT